MTLSTLIIRADGAFAETEELRREAFIAAFREAGFDWNLSKEVFAASCRLGGPRERMSDVVFRNLGRGCDAPDAEKLTQALHRKASKVFSELLGMGRADPRDGIREIIVAAHRESLELVIVSIMSKADVQEMLRQTLGSRGAELFDIVIVPDDPAESTAPEALYAKAAREIGVAAEHCLVIEASARAMEAARAAGFPAICTRSAYCTECPTAIDSGGFFEDLPSIIERSVDRRGEPLNGEERADLLAAFQQLACGTFDKDAASNRGPVMRVSDILKIKGSVVKTVEPMATVRSFSKALKTEGVGAMVVQDADGRLLGIITERDLSFGLAEYGNDLPNMQVSQLMTRELITCTPDDSLSAVAKVMTQRRIRHLPVVVDRKLTGLISIGDVLKYRLDEVQLEANMLREFALARR